MKKSTKKIINHLKPFIGHTIIRSIPVNHNTMYTDQPILLLGFTSNGCIICRDIKVENSQIRFVSEEYVLPLQFTDCNWITYKKALRAKNNSLNNWRGKKIRRINPTVLNDYSYMDSEGVTLISASKYHVLIILNGTYSKGLLRVLNFTFANPDDWILAE